MRAGGRTMEEMTMNFTLERPAAVRNAAEAKKGVNWFLEILVFGLVFLTVTVGETILTIPPMLVIMLTNPEFLAAALNGSTSVDEAANAIVSSDAVTSVCCSQIWP